MNPSDRRAFLRQIGLSAAAFTGASAFAPRALAVEPFDRPGPPRLKLSLAGYSFRNFFKHNQGRTRPETQATITLFDFIDFCARQNCDAEVTGYYFPSPITDEFLLQLKRHAHLRGVALSGTAVGNTFALPPGAQRDAQIEHVKQWIRHAATLGLPHIRIFAGSQPQGLTFAETKELCIRAIDACLGDAARYGVFLGLENHGGIVAEPDELLDIVRTLDNPWLGINLDSGNFHTVDPYADFARCVPCAVNVQVKVEMQAKDQAKEAADLSGLVQILRDGHYQGYVALEYEAAEDPWQAVPRYLNELHSLLAG